MSTNRKNTRKLWLISVLTLMLSMPVFAVIELPLFEGFNTGTGGSPLSFGPDIVTNGGTWKYTNTAFEGTLAAYLEFTNFISNQTYIEFRINTSNIENIKLNYNVKVDSGDVKHCVIASTNGGSTWFAIRNQITLPTGVWTNLAGFAPFNLELLTNQSDVRIRLDFWHNFNMLTNAYLDGFSVSGELPSVVDTGTPVGTYGLQKGDAYFGEMTGDGSIDLLAIGDNNGPAYFNVYTNNSSAFASPFLVDGSGYTDGGVALGDINGDKILDMIIGANQASTGNLNAYVGLAPSSFTQSNIFAMGSAGITNGDVVLGDLDNDGDLDLVVVGDSMGMPVLHVYGNSNNGMFYSNVAPGFTGLSNASLALGDIDRNGYLDIIAMGFSSSSPVIHYYLNYGSFSFSSANSLSIGIHSGDIALADMNDNGYLDIVVVGLDGSGNGKLMLITNQTYSSYYTGYMELDGGGAGSSVALGDINCDGKIDIFFTANGTLVSPEPRAGVLINRGFNRFMPTKPLFGLTGISNGTVGMLDANSDGRLDLFVMGSSFGTNIMKVYQSVTGTASMPNSPSSLYASDNMGKWRLNWTAPSDDSTPSASLRYDVLFSTNSAIISPLPPIAKERNYVLSSPANYMGMSNSYSIDTQIPTTQHIYWAVTAIDNGQMRSMPVTNVGMPDTTAPVLTERFPDVGWSNVFVGTKISLRFNESVYKGTNKQIVISNTTDGSFLTYTVGVSTNIISFGSNVDIEITQPLHNNSHYTVSYDAGFAIDTSSNACAAGNWYFYTGYAGPAQDWTHITSSPGFAPRLLHGLHEFNKELWLIGGASTNMMMGYPGFADVWKSADGTNWTQVTANAPFGPRYDFASVVYDNRLWLIGGRSNETGPYSDVWNTTNGVDWVQVSANAFSGGLFGAEAVALSNKIALLSGFSGAGGAVTSKVYSSVDGANWTLETTAPWQGRTNFNAVVRNGAVWLVGGNVVSWQGTNEVWYSHDLKVWNYVTSANVPEIAGATMTVGSDVYLVGGAKWGQSADVYRSQDMTNWYKISSSLLSLSLPARRDHAATLFNEHIWVVAGYQSWSTNYPDVFMSAEPVASFAVPGNSYQDSFERFDRSWSEISGWYFTDIVAQRETNIVFVPYGVTKTSNMASVKVTSTQHLISPVVPKSGYAEIKLYPTVSNMVLGIYFTTNVASISNASWIAVPGSPVKGLAGKWNTFATKIDYSNVRFLFRVESSNQGAIFLDDIGAGMDPIGFNTGDEGIYTMNESFDYGIPSDWATSGASITTNMYHSPSNSVVLGASNFLITPLIGKDALAAGLYFYGVPSSRIAIDFSSNRNEWMSVAKFTMSNAPLEYLPPDQSNWVAWADIKVPLFGIGEGYVRIMNISDTLVYIDDAHVKMLNRDMAIFPVAFCPENRSGYVPLETQVKITFPMPVYKVEHGGMAIIDLNRFDSFDTITQSTNFEEIYSNTGTMIMDIMASNISVIGSNVVVTLPHRLALGTKYGVMVSDMVTNAEGKKFPGFDNPYAWQFTTIGDTNKPVFTFSHPNGTITNSPITLNIGINEPFGYIFTNTNSVYFAPGISNFMAVATNVDAFYTDFEKFESNYSVTISNGWFKTYYYGRDLSGNRTPLRVYRLFVGDMPIMPSRMGFVTNDTATITFTVQDGYGYIALDSTNTFGEFMLSTNVVLSNTATVYFYWADGESNRSKLFSQTYVINRIPPISLSNIAFAQGAWKMYTVPYTAGLERSAVTEFSAYSSDPEFNIFAYDPVDGFYETKSMKAGSGYWLYAPVALDVALSKSNMVDSEKTQILSAPKAGWHLLGNPYGFAIDASKLKVVYGGVEKDLSNASDWLEPTLFVWRDAYNSTSVIRAADGFWVKTKVDNVSLKIVPSKAGYQPYMSMPLPSAIPRLLTQRFIPVRSLGYENKEFALTFSLKTDGESVDESALAGALLDGSDGSDRYDASKPPMVGSIPYIIVSGGGGDFAYDIREADGQTKEYMLTLDNLPLGKDISLVWQTPMDSMRYYYLLKDFETKEIINLREQTEVVFRKSGRKRYALYVATPEDAEAIYGGEIIEKVFSYPNPAKESATIRVECGSPLASTVLVKIFDIAGNLVKSEVMKEKAGYVYEYEWDLRADDGSKLPNGVYLYKIVVAEDTDDMSYRTGKLVIAGR